VTFPVPDFSTDDLSTGFTEFGDPSFVPDQQNPKTNVALDSDGVDDRLERSPISVAGDKEFTLTAFFKAPLITESQVFFSQFSGSEGFFIQAFPNILRIFARSTTSSEMTVTDVDSGLVFNTDWNKMSFSVNGNTGSNDANLRMVINGSEPSYLALNNHTGTGFATVTANAVASNFGVSGGPNQTTLSITGILSRIRYWRQALTIDEMIEESAEELSLIPNPLQGGIGRVNFRLDSLKELRWNKGPKRFNKN